MHDRKTHDDADIIEEETAVKYSKCLILVPALDVKFSIILWYVATLVLN